MITVATLALMAGLASEPANFQTVPRRPGMARFLDNSVRADRIEDFRAQRDAHLQRMVQHRVMLMDRLDQMIASGHCDRAQDVARRARYPDILQAVDTACETRTDAAR